MWMPSTLKLLLIQIPALQLRWFNSLTYILTWSILQVQPNIATKSSAAEHLLGSQLILPSKLVHMVSMAAMSPLLLSKWWETSSTKISNPMFCSGLVTSLLMTCGTTTSIMSPTINRLWLIICWQTFQSGQYILLKEIMILVMLTVKISIIKTQWLPSICSNGPNGLMLMLFKSMLILGTTAKNSRLVMELSTIRSELLLLHPNLAITGTSIFGNTEMIQVVNWIGWIRLSSKWSKMEKLVSSSHTCLQVVVPVSINGQWDSELSKKDINTSLDSQSMDMFITRTMDWQEVSRVEMLLVFSTGLVQSLPGSPSTHHSECLKLMSRLCYQ